MVRCQFKASISIARLRSIYSNRNCVNYINWMGPVTFIIYWNATNSISSSCDDGRHNCAIGSKTPANVTNQRNDCAVLSLQYRITFTIWCYYSNRTFRRNCSTISCILLGSFLGNWPSFWNALNTHPLKD